MTLKQAIAICDELRPGNRFSNELKTRWINELVGRIHTQVWLESMTTWQYFVYEYEEGADTGPILDIPIPYDRMFWVYLCAMVDFANGDYEKYENTYAMFNDVLRDYTILYINTHQPGLLMPKLKEAEGYEYNA